MLMRLAYFYRKFSSIFDQALTSGGNFLTIAICAHFLPLEEQGKLGFVYAFYMAVLFLNLTAIFQWASVRAPEERDRLGYLRDLFWLQFVIAFVSSMLVFGFILVFGDNIGWHASLLEVFLCLIFLVLQQLADFDRRSSYVFFSSSRALGSSLFLYPFRVIALVLVGPHDLVSALIVLVLSAVFPSTRALLVFKGLRSCPIQVSIDSIKSHLKASRFLILVAPFGWLWTFIPVFVLGIVSGSAAVAILTTVRSLTNVANVLMEQLETVVAASLGKSTYKQGPSGLSEASRRLMGWGGLLWLLGFLLLFLGGEHILTLTLGDNYSENAPIALILWLSYGVFFVARVYGMKYRFMKNTKVELFGNVASVLVLTGVSFPVIKDFGIEGAAFLLLLSSLTILFTQFVFARYSSSDSRECAHVT